MDLIAGYDGFHYLACAAFLNQESYLGSRVASHSFAALVNCQGVAVYTVYLQDDVSWFNAVADGRGSFVGLHYHHAQGVLADGGTDSSIGCGRKQFYGLGVFFRNIFRIRIYGLQHSVYAIVYQLGKVHRVHIFGSKGTEDVVLDFKSLGKLEVAALGLARSRCIQQ